jgi:hypothetical protein
MVAVRVVAAPEAVVARAAMQAHPATLAAQEVMAGVMGALPCKAMASPVITHLAALAHAHPRIATGPVPEMAAATLAMAALHRVRHKADSLTRCAPALT